MIQKLSERMICSFCKKTLSEAGCMVSSADMKTFKCGLCILRDFRFKQFAQTYHACAEPN